jgi:23S rRNA (adenine2503-C2)-methyltransferase
LNCLLDSNLLNIYKKNLQKSTTFAPKMENLDIIKTDLRAQPLADLEKTLAAWGEPRFRAKQIYEWLWKKSATDIETMSNLSKNLRTKLAEHFFINTLIEDKRQVSSDGTVKTRWKLHDGHLIESVLIPVSGDNRFTVCVSSQVGCSLTCKFCATGRMGRLRNLSAGEIYDQVTFVNRQCQEIYGADLTNVVYMGMGEPLLTWQAVRQSIEHLTSPEGLGMSTRRITISTAGIAKMIRKLADEGLKVNLALSLHAADDAKRNEIMPINETNSLAELMLALDYFYMKTKGRLSYEYITFDHFNDGPEDAKKLVKLCKRFPVRVNIIEYNPIGGVSYEKSADDRLNNFAAFLAHHDVTVTVRKSRGKDIDAACGQLANKN